MAPAAVQHQYLEGNAYLDCSQETAAMVDREIKEILDRCYSDVKALLSENRALLDEVAEFLLLKETITGEELMAFVNAAGDSEETATDEDFAEEPKE